MISGGPYVDVLSGRPANSIGKATVFVSHSWKYNLVEVVDNLISIGESAEGDWFCWFDVLMVSAHPVLALYACPEGDWFCWLMR
jgi:hypothetical protein